MTSINEINEFLQVLAKVYKKYFGKGPNNITVAVQPGFIVAKAVGVLTQIEKSLLETDNGVTKVERLRQEVFQRFSQSIMEELYKAKGLRISSIMQKTFANYDECIIIIFLKKPFL